MRVIEKPWGHEIIWSETEKYAAKQIFIKKGHRLSLQHHEVKDESIFILDGTMILCLADREVELNKNDSWHISPGTIHRFYAKDTDVLLMEVSTPELYDVVRHEDDYNRLLTR